MAFRSVALFRGEPEPSMRLLFVKLKHIGDALMMTPMLESVRRSYPEAEIWVVVRKGSEGILQRCPVIDHLLVSTPPEKSNRSWASWRSELSLLRTLRKQKFDHAFELGSSDRGRWLCVLARARHRMTPAWPHLPLWTKLFFDGRCTKDFRTYHQVRKDYEIVSEALSLPETIPGLQFVSEPGDFEWIDRQGLKNFFVIHTATRWKRKQWGLEKWAELCGRLLEKGPIILSSGPDEEEVAFSREINERTGNRMLATEGKLSWPQLAAAMRRSMLFVGVDTAAMHLAAACGTPSVALFGPTKLSAWHPWSCPYIVVRGDQCPPTQRPAQDAMKNIEVAEVLKACEQMLQLPRA